jgi:hypothetical protein
MGKLTPALLLALASACAGSRTPEAVKPSLPPASFHQVTILEPARTVVGLPHNPETGCCRSDHPRVPCVVDVKAALQATPEAQEFSSGGYGKDSAEYYLLLSRANERLWSTLKRVARRHGYDAILERGTVLLKPESTDVAVADVTEEVVHELSKR